jgi:hypothetical protein
MATDAKGLTGISNIRISFNTEDAEEYTKSSEKKSSVTSVKISASSVLKNPTGCILPNQNQSKQLLIDGRINYELKVLPLHKIISVYGDKQLILILQ